MSWAPRRHMQPPMVSPLDGPSGIVMFCSWERPAGPPTAPAISPAVSSAQACICVGAAKPLDGMRISAPKSAPRRIFIELLLGIVKPAPNLIRLALRAGTDRPPNKLEVHKNKISPPCSRLGRQAKTKNTL